MHPFQRSKNPSQVNLFAEKAKLSSVLIGQTGLHHHTAHQVWSPVRAAPCTCCLKFRKLYKDISNEFHVDRLELSWVIQKIEDQDADLQVHGVLLANVLCHQAVNLVPQLEDFQYPSLALQAGYAPHAFPTTEQDKRHFAGVVLLVDPYHAVFVGLNQKTAEGSAASFIELDLKHSKFKQPLAMVDRWWSPRLLDVNSPTSRCWGSKKTSTCHTLSCRFAHLASM